MSYPNLATAKMAELVSFYNENVAEDEQVKGFKTKAVGQQMCQALIAKLEGTETEDMTEEVAEVAEDNATSLLSQLTAASSGTKKTSTKNEGVWLNVKILFDKGLSNKEVLAQIHEMYSNSNTSYSCIAWYRNKYNKSGDKASAENLAKVAKAQEFATKHGLSSLGLEELCELLGCTLPEPEAEEVEVEEPEVEEPEVEEQDEA